MTPMITLHINRTIIRTETALIKSASIDIIRNSVLFYHCSLFDGVDLEFGDVFDALMFRSGIHLRVASSGG